MASEAKKRLFHDWAYGMFVHYGLYSIYGLGEWYLSKERLELEDYFKVAPDFKPPAGAARNWAALAKRAGMKYLCLTTRHHDGFFVGDDLLKEYCAACREFGLGVGFYYSVMNWADEDYRKGPESPEWRRFEERTCRQIKELMTDYGPVDYLFYDGCPPPNTWRVKELHEEIRKLQPELLISCRCRREEDVFSCEQHIKAMPGKLWEGCFTLNDSWGYHRHDHNWKSPEEVVKLLTTMVHNGGNLLLNVGPMADGTIQEEAVKLLESVGAWLRRNGEAVYGAAPHPFNYCDQEISTAQGDTAYIVLHNDCRGPERKLCGIDNRVKGITLLATGEEIAFEQSGDKIRLSGLPFKKAGELPRVLKLELEGQPFGIRNPMFPDCDIKID